MYICLRRSCGGIALKYKPFQDSCGFFTESGLGSTFGGKLALRAGGRRQVSPGRKYSPSAPSVFLLNSFIRLQRALWSVVVQRWNALSFSENIGLNIHEAPVKGSPSSDHEVSNGQVDQVEVDRRSHRLVEDHLVIKRVGASGFLSMMYFVPWLTWEVKRIRLE